MKHHILRFAPWVALIAFGIIGTSRLANTAPQRPGERLRIAMSQLRDAQEELRAARHDYCGHRAEAIRAIEAARRQLQFAIECNPR